MFDDLQLVEVFDTIVQLLQILLGFLSVQHQVAELLLLVSVHLGHSFLCRGDGMLQLVLLLNLVERRASALCGPLHAIEVSVRQLR